MSEHPMFKGFGAPVEAAAVEEPGRRRGLFSRLRENLTKSSRAMTQQIQAIAFDPDDEETWERLEEALLLADCGVPATVAIISELERTAAGGSLRTTAELVAALRVIVARMLEGERRLDVTEKPSIVLVVGVNGTGKTTTIGKLSEQVRRAGGTVVIGAADTFRAAAGEQLELWAERAGADFVGSSPGQDPASVAFDAVSAGVARGRDVVFIDTAGRLHNQAHLMGELEKIRRVIGQRLESAPHETLLVIDATTGQNGLQQARVFSQITPLTGIVLTKLDGTAKGGIALAIRHELGVPIKLVGVGEKLEDLRPFDPDDFARALFDEAAFDTARE